MAASPLSARALFDEGLEIASPEARREYLERACADAPLLLQEVEALLSAYAEAGKFDRAVETQLEALKLVPEGETALVSELQSHLEAFRAGEPWRE